jgi:aryl-alcohol dehydrogenase (NADP+)
VSVQNHYNVIWREDERELLPFCRAQGIGLIPYSPMARGFLAGDRRKTGGGETTRANSDRLAAKFYFADADFAIADRVGEVAARRGVSRMQVALAWVLSRPGVAAPIVGASKLQHLDEAVDALEVKLTPEDCAYLEEPYQPHTVVGPL